MSATHAIDTMFTERVLLILDNEEPLYREMMRLARLHDDDIHEHEYAVRAFLDELVPEELYNYDANPIINAVFTLAYAYVDVLDIAHHYAQKQAES